MCTERLSLVTSVHSSDCLHLAVIFLLTNSMAADTASTSENSPSHRLHPQNSLSSPETPEPKAKRLKTDSDVIVHQIDHHSFQTDACSIHQSSKSIPVCVAQPIRREKMKLSEDVNFRTKVAHSDDTDVGSEKHKHSSVHVEGVPMGSKEECIDGSPALPIGKKHHIFVSHSTADKKVVRERLVLPLREMCGFIVNACYHFMTPDESRYEDSGISQAFNDSCVLIIALSKQYLSSARCIKEYNQAVRMCEEKKCCVIVAGMEPCSRPPALKLFLYLDFIDNSKFSNVWIKLLETINTSLKMRSCELIQPKVEAIDGQVCKEEESYVRWDPEDQGEAPLSDHTSLLTREHQGLVEPPVPGEDGSGKDASDEDGSGEAGSGQADNGSGGEGVVGDGDGGDEGGEGGGGNHSHGDGASGGGDGSSGEYPTSGGVGMQWQQHQEMRQEEEEATTRGRDEEDIEEGQISDEENQALKVTNFYNKLAEPNADRRNESPIYQMRNFNNWVKSILIRTYLPKRATVLDLCCGKGGDLLKWKEGNIEYLVCADISDASVDECQRRYSSKKMATGHRTPYGAEFLVADCSEERLRDKYGNAGRRFHLTSCQFSLHYAFESYGKAHMMLRNACENLLPGGYFIGTTVDSNELVRKLREAGPSEDGIYKIGNDIFSVKADLKLNQCLNQSQNQPVPLFGAKYNFWLHEVVDLPEYLIHMPLLHSMLSDFGMEPVAQQNFHDFFTDHRHKPEDLSLLFRMQAFSLESGTLSAAQWEVIGLYLVFVYRRKSSGTHL